MALLADTETLTNAYQMNVKPAELGQVSAQPQ